MLHESATFRDTKHVEEVLASNEEVFRYCVFESANIEGGSFDGVFVSCEFRDIEFYWGLFNSALFFGNRFERCTFQGTSFSSCRFVECTFTDCSFVKDNLASPCSARETKLFACAAHNCEGWNELFANHMP